MVIFHSYVSLPEGSHLWVKPQFLHVAYHKKSYLEDPGAMTKDSALMTFVQDAAACNRTADTFEIVFDSKARGWSKLGNFADSFTLRDFVFVWLVFQGLVCLSHFGYIGHHLIDHIPFMVG